MLDKGIIEPSDSSWRSCPVLVSKTCGMFRFCIDYRQVNKTTKAIAYPLRNMDDILDKLSSANFISKLDLSQAYHQIPLDPKCRGHRIFSARATERLFHFIQLLYGLTNAQAVFQRIVDNLIKAAWEPNVFAYLDDVIITSPTFEEHEKYEFTN